MFNPSRDQVRQFFFDVWAKYRAGQPLAGAEQPALDAVLAFPCTWRSPSSCRWISRRAFATVTSNCSAGTATPWTRSMP